MNNLEKSKIALGSILAFLYERGIQSGSFSLEQLSLDESYRPFLSQGFQWLVSEGLVRTSRIQIYNNGALVASDACLTAKGFDVLGTTMIGKTETLGQKLSELTKESIGTARAAVIGEVVGQVIGVAAKTFLSPSA